ncbi:NAD-dependent epimerase/dehydratase family protein [Azospirillum sp.]|uniref:NAD-dependent epimerase/dehydratase family protein n=1 Tax=Azospirillum sp. TaxID=34012 RepID=UPI002D4F3CFF|nr:NAD-dependent epimerase/dehydratase family protein [Azospirillum sp.]HYD70505.1 NAD-dependent epimerase/dehydratase family protein [Azospirillum sp.]
MTDATPRHEDRLALRPDWQKRRVLITGGLGFIGASLAHRLVALGADVLLVDSLVPEYGGNPFNVQEIASRVRINISDIRDPYSMRHMIEGREVIFNLAGQTSHMDSMTDPFNDLEINGLAQLRLLEICRHHNPGVHIVFASTRQIYGKPDYLPVDERHRLNPVDVNGVNKVAGEHYHILYNNVYGLRSSVLRLTNTYGPRMRVKDARQTFLGVWVRAVVEGRPFEVWGGAQLRDFTYVDDAVDALLALAETDGVDGQAFNLGGDCVISLRDTAALLAEAGNSRFEIREFPADRKRIDIGDYYADDSLFRRLSGWQPRVPLAEGLRRTVAFYRDHLRHYL